MSSQRLYRLLLLLKVETVYFGDIGKGPRVPVDYFTCHGTARFPVGKNPAEYEVICKASDSTTNLNWAVIWRQSSEYQGA